MARSAKTAVLIALLGLLTQWVGTGFAEERAYLGTVIQVDTKSRVLKVISTDGAMLEVLADGKAAEHLDQIPLNSLIDLVVEVKPGSKPRIKSWKMAQAQSPCRIFDGSNCIP
jgi:hypothetical protein